MLSNSVGKEINTVTSFLTLLDSIILNQLKMLSNGDEFELEFSGSSEPEL
jgi:hypothetical protein